MATIDIERYKKLIRNSRLFARLAPSLSDEAAAQLRTEKAQRLAHQTFSGLEDLLLSAGVDSDKVDALSAANADWVTLGDLSDLAIIFDCEVTITFRPIEGSPLALNRQELRIVGRDQTG